MQRLRMNNLPQSGFLYNWVDQKFFSKTILLDNLNSYSLNGEQKIKSKGTCGQLMD